MKYILPLIFILLFSFACFWPLIHKKYINPFLLFYIFGKKGSGKSTLLCKYGLKYQKKGYTIYTNMDELHFPGLRHININDLGSCVPEPYSCCLFDEVGIVYDNRKFKQFRDDTRDFYKYQRKYQCVCFLASQSYDVDKKLRDLIDDMYLVTNLLPALSLIRPIAHGVTLTEPSGDAESRVADKLKFKFCGTWRLLYIPRWTKHFDSFAAPERPYLPYTVDE